MNKEIEKIECELCGIKCNVLYPIILSVDFPFYNRRGVCKKCFDTGDIDENILKRNLKTINEQIEKAKEQVIFWSKELEKLKSAVEGRK